MEVIKTVCPPAERLSVIVNNVSCDECDLTFRNEPRLRMHVLKIHRRENLEKTVKENIRYHCPEISCVYSPKSQRYFTRMKYLKQHYLKVHAAKTFACTSLGCDKSFSTEAARQAHLRVCGVEFSCASCSKIFGTYEALLTHAKRTSHGVDEKYKRILVRNQSRPSPPAQSTAVPRGNRPVSIRPRCSFQPNKVASDIGVQTDDAEQSRAQRESRETQTSSLSTDKMQRRNVETQTRHASTFNASTSSDSRKTARKTAARPRRRAKDTIGKLDLAFNDDSTSENLFPSSPLQLRHDVGLQDCFWEEKNPSLGTQTSPEKDLLEALNDRTDLVSFYDRQDSHRDERHEPHRHPDDQATLNAVQTGCYSFGAVNDCGSITRADPMLTVQTNFPDKFSSIETQTEAASSSSTSARGTFFDPEVALSSNTETQTTENFPNIEQLLYSNTCTQTCNEILPSDLGLSDIQTQTAWPELEDAALSVSVSTGVSPLISTETQTRGTSCQENPCGNVSSCRSWFLNNRTSHTETQTDLLSMFDEF